MSLKLKTYCVVLVKFVDEYEGPKAGEVAVADALDSINTKRGPNLAMVYTVDESLMTKTWLEAVKELKLTPDNQIGVYRFNQVNEVRIEKE